MKLEEMIKKVVKLNNFNKELYINKRYKVLLTTRGKTFEFDSLDLSSLERYYVEMVYEQLTTRVFERLNCNNSWYLEVNIKNDILCFDLFIKEVEI